MTHRLIYKSSNGDVWSLMGEEDRFFVRHRPNVASGGTVTDYELDAFLHREKHSPQNAAFMQLIGTLVTDD